MEDDRSPSELEPLGQSLERILDSAPESPTAQPTTTTIHEDRTCETCEKAFVAEIQVRYLFGRERRFFDYQECPGCRAEREEREQAQAARALEVEKQGVREELRRTCGLPRRFWKMTFGLWVERGWTQTKTFRAVRKWAHDFPDTESETTPDGYPSLVLQSEKPGHGKTTLGACVINHLIDRWDGNPARARLPVRYETGPGLALRIRATYNIRPGEESWREAEAEVYHSLAGVRLLVLDDVGDPGKEKASEHTRRMYFHLIDQRYGLDVPLLLITNSRGKPLEEVMGEFAVDRIAEMADGRVHDVRGRSRRQRIGGL